MYINKYKYACIHTCTHIHLACLHIDTYIHVCKHTYTHIYSHMSACIHIYYTPKSVYQYIHMSIYTPTMSPIYIHMYLCHTDTSIHIYLHMYIHTCINRYMETHWQGATVHSLITEVKQLWAQLALGLVTICDALVAAKMWLTPAVFCYCLCHMSIQEVPRVLPNL